jgi:signal transduction histidine kinase
VQAFCVVPLLRAGRLAAALYAADVAPRPWTLRDRGLLRSVAERVWPAYQTARLLTAEQRAREEAEAARRVAEAANAAKARFLATMSHELRTPLNIIAGHAQLIEMGIHGPVTDPQREALSRVRRSQQHLLALIDDVLTFARLESARVEFRPSSVDLDALLAEALRLVEPLAAAKGVALAGAPGPATHRAWVDEEKARQVVLNLLANAVKFTPAGGRIAATVTAGADGLLEVHVTDSGVGIPAERLEDIFEPFVQVDGGLTRASEGTGLGLAISRELARRMGGELRASSVVGEGSTFVLSVPAMGRDGNG